MKLEDNNLDNIKNDVIYENNEETSLLYNHNNEFNQTKEIFNPKL